MRPLQTTKRVLCFLVLLGAAQCALAQTLTGRVAKMSDGDTITVLDRENVQHKVRLYGIDAPEKKQPYGINSYTDSTKQP